MNKPRARHYRRTAQACENCRRKKTRCPGQKPKCSTCTRLRQQCTYADSNLSAEHHSTENQIQLSTRLTQVEQKLDLIISNIDTGSTPETTIPERIPPSASRHASVSNLSPAPASLGVPSLLKTAGIMAIASKIYFERIHRQPLWLFDAASSPPSEWNEELMDIILALALTSSPDCFTDNRLQSPDFYSGTARRAAVLKVADGTAGLQTAQTLCLLAFHDVITGSFQTAGLNIGLAKSVFTCHIVGSQSPTNTTGGDEQSKLFWSLSFLAFFYGSPTLIPSIGEDILSPRFATVEAKLASMPCPPLPREPYSSGRQYLPDIWSNCVRISSIWADVRSYVSECIQGLSEPPWRPNSDYVKLCSRLLDIESTHPASLSYNAVKFADRDGQEVLDNREMWFPWLRAQMTYHAIHCVLNHPFLYSFGGSRRLTGNNSFWTSSSEKALRHCTWIARLIRVAHEKGLELNDPFFAQAAGIAGSLHLYWTHASDDQLRSSALKNLEICHNLVNDMAVRWPVCKLTKKGLDKIMDSIILPDSTRPNKGPTVSATRSGVWSLLDVAATQYSIYLGDRYQPRDTWGDVSDEHDYLTVNNDGGGSSPTNIRESTAHYASPPEWITAGGGQRYQLQSQRRDHEHSYACDMDVSDCVDDIVDPNMSWGSLEHMMMLGDGSTPFKWWEFDNL